jgi:enoyl-CoA hydratase/carnithine racemase
VTRAREEQNTALQITDDNRVRTLTLNRPDVLNAFNEELYHATAVALRDAATDPEVAVVLLTGAGRAFSAGNDLNEMQRRITDPTFNDQGSHFPTMIDALTDLPKPLICAVNGVGSASARPSSATRTWCSCRRRRG